MCRDSLGGEPASPHGVQEGAIVHQAQQLVGGGHVVGNRFLPVVEKSVRSPDLTGQQVVQGKDFHGTIKLQPFISPGLPEKDINGVFLWGERREKSVCVLLSSRGGVFSQRANWVWNTFVAQSVVQQEAGINSSAG